MSWFGRIWRRLLALLGRADLLCDSCRYDHPHACRNPRRPNVSECRDYSRR